MSVQKDRHSNTGVAGGPKKGGAGGHGAWGKGGLDDLKGLNEDQKDPNYDSEDEEEAVISKLEVVSPIDAVLTEYFRSGDIPETLKSIAELNLGDTQQQFIKKALARGLEKQAYERELVSKLLSAVYEGAIDPLKIAEGFQVALNALDDFVLDTPDAVDVLSKFLARAIVDEVIAPAFIKSAQSHVDSNRAKECLALASGLVTEKHKLDRLAHVWGPGDFHSVRHMKEEINTLLEEFLVTQDLNEADRCVRKLNAPSFHFQIVKQAIRSALSKNENDKKKLAELLGYFVRTGLVSSPHLEQGFALSFASLSDLKLDHPNAATTLNEFVQLGKQQGWLSQSFDGSKQ
jgi:programmed cell death protein 4